MFVLFETGNIITCDVQRTEAVEDADAGRLQPAQQQQGQAQERGEDHGGDRRQGLHPGGGARQPGTYFTCLELDCLSVTMFDG